MELPGTQHQPNYPTRQTSVSTSFILCSIFFFLPLCYKWSCKGEDSVCAPFEQTTTGFFFKKKHVDGKTTKRLIASASTHFLGKKKNFFFNWELTAFPLTAKKKPLRDFQVPRPTHSTQKSRCPTKMFGNCSTPLHRTCPVIHHHVSGLVRWVLLVGPGQQEPSPHTITASELPHCEILKSKNSFTTFRIGVSEFHCFLF